MGTLFQRMNAFSETSSLTISSDPGHGIWLSSLRQTNFIRNLIKEYPAHSSDSGHLIHSIPAV
jgi:hypothetical protein